MKHDSTKLDFISLHERQATRYAICDQTVSLVDWNIFALVFDTRISNVSNVGIKVLLVSETREVQEV